jgi:hypothetical protein
MPPEPAGCDRLREAGAELLCRAAGLPALPLHARFWRRTIDRRPATGLPQVPGFAILIADARSSQNQIDVTPLNGLPVAHAQRLKADPM